MTKSFFNIKYILWECLVFQQRRYIKVHEPFCMCPMCVAKRNHESELMFRDLRPNGSIISGVRGGATHFHDYHDLGVGHIKVQPDGKPIHVNNFTRTVDPLLPNWIKKDKQTNRHSCLREPKNLIERLPFSLLHYKYIYSKQAIR